MKYFVHYRKQAEYVLASPSIYIHLEIKEKKHKKGTTIGVKEKPDVSITILFNLYMDQGQIC